MGLVINFYIGAKHDCVAAANSALKTSFIAIFFKSAAVNLAGANGQKNNFCCYFFLLGM